MNKPAIHPRSVEYLRAHEKQILISLPCRNPAAQTQYITVLGPTFSGNMTISLTAPFTTT